METTFVEENNRSFSTYDPIKEDLMECLIFSFFLAADASSVSDEKTKSPSFLSHIFFVWFDLFIIKGKEGSLRGPIDFSPDSENR